MNHLRKTILLPASLVCLPCGGEGEGNGTPARRLGPPLPDTTLQTGPMEDSTSRNNLTSS